MSVAAPADCASTLSSALRDQGLSPFIGTPCGILAPLYARLQSDPGVMAMPREDSAIGVAAGCAMAGRSPVVLMQNSGLGQSVNAIASLVVPYAVPLLLIVGMRGTGPDATPENEVMGRMSEIFLKESGIPFRRLDPPDLLAQVSWGRDLVADWRRPAALLVPPTLFGWRP
ncbi:thiamine pyrophosphate-binding protein [Streptomyces sp. NBC_00444]|uniref:thiamine pyrophosphate-binding protein n=1 Tax=Streptomyces sp. NBC_00444 TaxID=2975744 RepID=UPI002E2421DE